MNLYTNNLLETSNMEALMNIEYEEVSTKYSINQLSQYVEYVLLFIRLVLQITVNDDLYDVIKRNKKQKKINTFCVNNKTIIENKMKDIKDIKLDQITMEDFLLSVNNLMVKSIKKRFIPSGYVVQDQNFLKSNFILNTNTIDQLFLLNFLKIQRRIKYILYLKDIQFNLINQSLHKLTKNFYNIICSYENNKENQKIFKFIEEINEMEELIKKENINSEYYKIYLKKFLNITKQTQNFLNKLYDYFNDLQILQIVSLYYVVTLDDFPNILNKFHKTINTNINKKDKNKKIKKENINNKNINLQYNQNVNF